MSLHTVATAAPMVAPVTRRSRAVRAALALAVAASLGGLAGRAEAQSAPAPGALELRPVVGAFVPTGDHRDLLEDAVLVGAQASYSFTPNAALVGSFGWAPSKDRTTTGEETVDLFQYDLGIEGRLNDLTPATSVSTQPYLALGAGARTYNYRDLSDTDAETNFVGYGAIGLDVVQAGGPIGVRLEVRDNVSAFKGLQGQAAERKARNDLQFSAGLTFRL